MPFSHITEPLDVAALRLGMFVDLDGAYAAGSVVQLIDDRRETVVGTDIARPRACCDCDFDRARVLKVLP